MKYLNALNLISGIGPQKIKILLNHFETPENIWKAEKEEILLSGIGEKLAEKIITEKNSFNPDEEFEKLQKENIDLIIFTDQRYPKLLREIPNPPYILYTKGEFDPNAAPMVSIVGSRKYTSYGAQVATSLARDMARAGITVVSGMAIGIDTFSHRGALDGKGKTVAVLGNGLDDKNIYPKVNFNLSKNISQNGMLLSEYPAGTSAGPLTFPARNRIIAGMSLGTVVIEASLESGALITAQMALDYNREVFSVPGSIFSSASFGTNDLIKKGAKPITSLSDILEELDLLQTEIKKDSVAKNPGTEEEKIILKILSPDPIHIDNISKLSKLETSKVSSTLSMMEIKGWTKNIGGQNYIAL